MPLVMHSHCVEDKVPLLECPASPSFGQTPNEVSGYDSYPLIKCKVCGMTIGSDTNAQAEVYSGTITFGPNMFQNVINETNIDKYKVYLATSGDEKVGPALTEVNASSSVGSSCCTIDAYSVTLSDVVLTRQVSDKIMIVPVDAAGTEMPTGISEVVDSIEASYDTECPSLQVYIGYQDEIPSCAASTTTTTVSTSTT